LDFQEMEQMNLAVELAMLRASHPGVVISGIDTATGNTTPSSGLFDASAFSQAWWANVRYVPSTNTIYIMQNGIVLKNINFGNASVVIDANNVVLQNCTFTGTKAVYSVVQNNGYSGATIENCTFTTGGVPTGVGTFVSSHNEINIINNTFLYCPKDAIDIGAGVVSGNYIFGAGYTPTSAPHDDGIWVTNTSGPVLIENNFIDYCNGPGSVSFTNDCIRVTTELGSVNNVTIIDNILIGAASAIDAGNVQVQVKGTYSNITIKDNDFGFNQYFGMYLGPQIGVTATGNLTFDFSNPIYSQQAWAAYQGAGIATDSLVTPGASTAWVSPTGIGTATLYGGGVSGMHLSGGNALEAVFVGGAGRQFMTGGTGRNVYAYLSIGDSLVNAPDVISNFNVATDVIDLHSIDANPLSASLDNFTFVGGNAFSAGGGQVRVVQDVADNQTLVQADLIGDSSADFEVTLNGLVNLTAANFVLTSGQYAAVTAPYATIADFESSQSSLDRVAGGFSIVDSSADVQADLAGLQADAAKIGKITLTDSTASEPAVLTLSAANAVQDAAILTKIAGPYVLDTTLADGTTTVTGHGNGLTINVGAGDHIVTGGGTSDTFYFAAKFGSVNVTDFAPNFGNSAHDTISLAKTDFANWATLVADGHASGANTIFTSADGATLTVAGVAYSAFQSGNAALKADFTFHS
jgi:hypothetical protein